MRIDSDLRGKDGEIREISVIGALVHCPVQPPLETEVVLEVVPPGSMAPMELSGRVLYHAGTGTDRHQVHLPRRWGVAPAARAGPPLQDVLRTVPCDDFRLNAALWRLTV